MLRNYKCPWLNLNNTKVLNQYFKKIIICQLLQVFVTVNMTLHTYNKRNSFFTAIEQNIFLENNTVPNETADPILRLEKLMISRFDGLGQQILKLKDIIIKYLQIENTCLRKRTVGLKKNYFP